VVRIQDAVCCEHSRGQDLEPNAEVNVRSVCTYSHVTVSCQHQSKRGLQFDSRVSDLSASYIESTVHVLYRVGQRKAK
jgi:hypothetical protein